MTFKRIMLVVLPVMGAIFIFMALRWVYLDWEAGLTGYQPVPGAGRREMPAGGREMVTPGGLLHNRSENLNLVRKDATGRMEMRFLADVVEHRTDNTADIERPRIQFFTSGGEIITLLAEKGLAVTKGSLGNIADIESGRLWGNVILVHDRGTPEDDADDIFVGIEDLVFNNETYQMSTDGPVVLVGGEMSLTAYKMTIALDRETRRIKTMNFDRDIFVTLQTSRRMSFIQGDRKQQKTPPTAAPAGAAAPDSSGAPAPDSSGAAPPKVESGDLWRIELEGDVDARQATQRMRCDHLTLYNRQSSARNETKPETEPGVDEGGKGAEHKAAEDKAAEDKGAEKAETETAANPLLLVVADGPLDITPVRTAEQKGLGDKQHQVTATGQPVRIEDGETLILGDAVQFNQETGVGRITGKDKPIRLEQPGRLRLTGRRLDFDRNRLPPTVEVTGEGWLEAKVRTAGLTGSPNTVAAGATADQVEPSALDASWKRRMQLEFYSLPSGETGGLGEIKSAAFDGQAVIKQADGILKGDNLLIDIFPAQAKQGQAVRRLVGHGDVYLKNAQPTAKDPAKSEAKPTIGDITCQNLEIQFQRDAAGATQPKRLEASGSVAINDPQGKIRAENLTVAFGPNEKGRMEARFLEAFGNVLIDREDLHADGTHVRQDKATGALLLEGKPATARRLHEITTAAGEKVQVQSRIVGPHIEFSETEGKARVTGAGELELPATTDLRGRRREKPEPLIVQWAKGMLFQDGRNFAHFDGTVKATTGGSRLNSQRLWIYFVDRPDTGKATEPKTETDKPETPAAKPEPAGDEIADLFGQKALVRILAEKDVLAVEEQLADDQTLRHRMEIIADNLTYLEQNRKAYVRGPGRLRVLARERVRTGEQPKPGLPPGKAEGYWKDAVPDGYARTEVGWVETMAYDGTGERAYFSGQVEATHVGRGMPGEAESRRRAPTTTRITSRDLQVVFAEKKPPADAITPPTKPPDTPREQRMTVEKLIANGSVLLWVDDRRGSAARLLYQRQPEMIRLYRGPGSDEWARLWQENEATQEFGLIAARTITYDPGTGRVDVIEQQIMTVAPKPVPVVKPLPKLVPRTKP